ncbi:MAG: metallophosphoesterase [Oscillospiraceae bacterium]|jgi:hypothetical protein|nr:metallophosphoesterase [Oscillospiraceae bacterium]
MLKIWHLTDTHFSESDRSAVLLDAVLEAFLAEADCDILLISGDLSSNGRAREHAALLPRLRRVQAQGKRVYVITATHDYGLGFLQPCPDDGSDPLGRPDGKVYQSDLRGLYDEFGFRTAIAEYEKNSYVAQLSENVRLLALNDDGDGREFCGFDEAQMAWALEQIAKAKAEGQYIFGMTHHPSQPPSPVYPLISKRDMLGNYEENTRRLANAGLRVLFTGHSHMHNIAPVTTPEGNPYWDVNTGAIGQFPMLYRVLTLADNGLLHVETRRPPELTWEGKSLQEQVTVDFDFMLRNIVESMDADYDRFAHSVGGMSMSPEQAYKLKFPLHLAGMFINRVTLGGLGTLLACRHKIPKAVRGDSFKELFLELIRNMYAGEENYSLETDTGKALLAIAGRLNLPLKKVWSKIGAESLPAFLLSIIYDDSPDHEADIMLG